MYDVVVKFAISSPDEFLSVVAEPGSSNNLYSEFHVAEKEMASCAVHIASVGL